MSTALADQFSAWIQDRTSEGVTLEFKSGKLLDPDTLKRSGRHQLTKAVASLANTEGGLVAIGVAEAEIEKGWAEAAHLEPAPHDWNRDRLLQFLNDNVSPPIPRLDVTAERFDSGVLILVDVPVSFLGHQSRREDGKGGEYRTRRANGVSEPLDGRDVRQLLNRTQVPDPVLELHELSGIWHLLLTTRTAVIDRYRITAYWGGSEFNGLLPHFAVSAVLPTFGRNGHVTYRQTTGALIFPGVHEQVTYVKLRFDDENRQHHFAALVQVPGAVAKLFAWHAYVPRGASAPVVELESEAWWRGIDLRDPLGSPLEYERGQSSHTDISTDSGRAERS